MIESLFPAGAFSEQQIPIIAGPCSIESEAQIADTMEQLSLAGIRVVRAGAWKPRTQPGHFEGVGEIGLRWMRETANRLGQYIGTEVCLPSHARLALDYRYDFVWLGARTTSSPFLVEEIARVLEGSELPVLVKNPIAPDFHLWQGAVERLQRHHIERIALILRGFTAQSRGLLRNDPMWHEVELFRRALPDLPILCDPSHISGESALLREVSSEAIRRGYDGLFLESHSTPSTALTDAAQQITPEQIKDLLHREEHAEDGILRDYREDIDRIDDELIHLLDQRMRLTRLVGEWKADHHLSLYQPERLRSMIEDHRRRAGLYGVSEELVEELFRTIHDHSLSSQREQASKRE